MGKTVWTAEEARERASFVLGVSPDSSTAAARTGYREQLERYPGDSEHERVARRTLMAAWAVWCEATPDLVVVTDGEVVGSSSGAAAMSHHYRPRVTDRHDGGRRVGARERASRHTVQDGGSVEVVEVVRERSAPATGVLRSVDEGLRVAPRPTPTGGRVRRTIYVDRDERRLGVTDVRL